jgi:hypothetical protein
MFGTHVFSVVPEPTAAEGTAQDIIVQEVHVEMEVEAEPELREPEQREPELREPEQREPERREPEQREPERVMASAKQSCKKFRTQL